jgi:hypothetical protein
MVFDSLSKFRNTYIFFSSFLNEFVSLQIPGEKRRCFRCFLRAFLKMLGKLLGENKFKK